MLYDRFVKVNLDQILLDYNQNGFLTNNDRSKVIKHTAEFMIEIFGEYPSKQQKTMTGKALVTLFPCLKMKDTDTDGLVI